MTFTARPTPAGRMNRPDHGISSPFGYSPGYRGGEYMHHGQDYYWLYADVAGSRKVFAAGAGQVVAVEYDSTMGLCITIDHGDGLRSRSCHMPEGSARVRVGDVVTSSTLLGPMGNSGSAAFGEFHLHFEAWVGGARVDPEPYFNRYTPAVRPKDDVRRVAAALNARGLGRTSSSDVDGIPGPNLYWMIQTAGTQDGIYNGSVDGITGPKTEAAFDTYVTNTIPKPPPPVVLPKTHLDGIDISGHQTGLDISKVPSDFVIVKATQGNGFVSEETHTFMDQAIALGKKIGIYHFADGVDVNTEADWFLLNAKRYAGKAIPILDFEGPALAQGAAWALAWLRRVEAAWGAKPWFYAQGSVVSGEQYRAIADAGYALWRAAYWDNEPGGYELAPLDPTIDKGVWPQVTARQYRSTGKLDGWAGNLDLNIFYGLESDWDAMAKVVPVVPPVEPPVVVPPVEPPVDVPPVEEPPVIVPPVEPDPVDPPAPPQKVSMLGVIIAAVIGLGALIYGFITAFTQ